MPKTRAGLSHKSCTSRSSVSRPSERQPPLGHVVEHERQHRLHAGQARGRGGIGLFLFLARVRRVIRTDRIKHTCRNRSPQRRAVFL